MIVSKLIEFLAVVTKAVTQVNDSKKIKSLATNKSQPWRWLNAKPFASKSLMKVMDKKEIFASARLQHALGDVQAHTVRGNK